LTFAVSATIVPLIPIGLILTWIGGYDIILQFRPRQSSCIWSGGNYLLFFYLLLLGDGSLSGLIFEVGVQSIIPKNILKCRFYINPTKN